MSVKGKGIAKIRSGECLGDERKRSTEDLSKGVDDVKTEIDILSQDKSKKSLINGLDGIRYRGSVN